MFLPAEYVFCNLLQMFVHSLGHMTKIKTSLDILLRMIKHNNRLSDHVSTTIFQICSINTEAVDPRRPVKMLFLKVLKYSQENFCTGVSF